MEEVLIGMRSPENDPKKSNHTSFRRYSLDDKIETSDHSHSGHRLVSSNFGARFVKEAIALNKKSAKEKGGPVNEAPECREAGASNLRFSFSLFVPWVETRLPVS